MSPLTMSFKSAKPLAPLTDPDVAPYAWYEKTSLMRAVMNFHYGLNLLRRSTYETPRDNPRYRSNREAWRVLLVGNGPTHGWGVTTHALGLTGQLAREITRLTNTGVDVDYVGDELMAAETTLHWLNDTHVSDYDQIVFVLSMNDAARITDPVDYKAAIARILNQLREQRRPGVPLVVVGIQPLHSVAGYDNWLGNVGQRHADRLNIIMRKQIEANGDTFMELAAPELEPGRPLGSPSTYRAWAAAIAEVAAPLLPAGEPQQVTTDAARDWSWAPSEAIMNLDNNHANDYKERLKSIADAAGKRFLGQTSVVSLIEGENQFFPHSTGIQPSRVPLELTYCKEAIKQDEPLLVTNAANDERFKDNPYIQQTQLPFYLGTALKSRDGEVIGSFCVMSAIVRPAATVSIPEFKKYAEQAQAELWRIEDEENAKG